MDRTEMDLEQRIARVESRLELYELNARFNLFADQRRWQELSELFAEDGVFDVEAPVTGRPAILEFLLDVPRRWDFWWHFNSNEVVAIDGDRAEGVAYFDAPFVAAGVSYACAGRYDDTYVRGADGAWRFQARVLHFAWRSPLLTEGWAGELPEGFRPVPR